MVKMETILAVESMDAKAVDIWGLEALGAAKIQALILRTAILAVGVGSMEALAITEVLQAMSMGLDTTDTRATLQGLPAMNKMVITEALQLTRVTTAMEVLREKARILDTAAMPLILDMEKMVMELTAATHIPRPTKGTAVGTAVILRIVDMAIIATARVATTLRQVILVTHTRAKMDIRVITAMEVGRAMVDMDHPQATLVMEHIPTMVDMEVQLHMVQDQAHRLIPPSLPAQPPMTRHSPHRWECSIRSSAETNSPKDP